MVEDSAAGEAGQPAGSRVGSLFGPYRLIRLLGSGGFGEVYEAEDTTMQRAVALKLLNSSYSQDPVFRERLFREAHTAGRLREPHVLPIHRCGEIDGQVYIDMRLVRGVDTESLVLSDGPLDPGRAVAIVRQIAGALDAAHAASVIHRDVKPANILLADGDFASLVDFGLANAAGDSRLTKPGKAVGTFEYVAPERLTGAVVDHRCDVYALACVLYEFLTGEPPYAHYQDLAALMTAQLTAPIPLPSRQRPELPAGFDEVIVRGMAKNPDQRYPSAGALADGARRALGIGVSGAPVAPDRTAPPQTAPWQQTTPAPPPAPATAPPLFAPPSHPKPRRRTAIAIAVIAVAVAVAAAVTIWVLPQPAADRNPATGSPRPSSTVSTALRFPEMKQVRGVAVDTAGNVYASALGEHVADALILKLPTGQTAAAELPFGPIYSWGLAVDDAANVYVADTEAPGVWKLAPGAPGPSLLPFGPLGYPAAVAVGKDGTVYVADSAARQVLKLPPGAGSASRMMPTTLLNTPQGVAVDNDANVYIVDTGDRRVLKVARGADTATELPFGGLDRPYGVAVAADGTVYVTDPGRHHIVKLASGATTSTEVQFPDLRFPYGMTLDKDGDMYVADCEGSNNCVRGRVLELGAAS